MGMNERIAKLLDDAGLSIQHGGIVLTKNVSGGEALEKFAELIVRECAKVAFNDWCEGTNEASSQMAILKHFGVEE